MRFVRSSPLGAIAAVVILATLVVAIFAARIAPYDPLHNDYSAARQPPSAEHVLGTDNLGRDVLSRVIYGLRISLLVVFLFVVIIVCGMMIALHAKDRFGLLLSGGIVALVGLQAAVNIGVTTSLLPNKGLPLPFISYGGSNLVACLFGVGLLLNVYRQGVFEPANNQRAAMQVRVTPRI